MPGGPDRTVRTALLVGGVILVLFPIIRFVVLPRFVPVEGPLAAAIAAAIAAVAAGAIAPWLVRRVRRG